MLYVALKCFTVCIIKKTLAILELLLLQVRLFLSESSTLNVIQQKKSKVPNIFFSKFFEVFKCKYQIFKVK